MRDWTPWWREAVRTKLLQASQQLRHAAAIARNRLHEPRLAERVELLASMAEESANVRPKAVRRDTMSLLRAAMAEHRAWLPLQRPANLNTDEAVPDGSRRRVGQVLRRWIREARAGQRDSPGGGERHSA